MCSLPMWTRWDGAPVRERGPAGRRTAAHPGAPVTRLDGRRSYGAPADPARTRCFPTGAGRSDKGTDARGHLRLVLLVGGGDVAEQPAHPVERVGDALRGEPPLLVQLGELHGGLAVGPALEHRGVDAAGQQGLAAGGVGSLRPALPGHRLQGGDVDLHGSSWVLPGPSRSRRTVGGSAPLPLPPSTAGAVVHSRARPAPRALLNGE